MQAWFECFGPSSEPLHETFSALPHFLIRIRAPTATARKPCSEASSLIAAALQHSFVAGALVLPLVELMVHLLMHQSNIYNKSEGSSHEIYDWLISCDYPYKQSFFAQRTQIKINRCLFLFHKVATIPYRLQSRLLIIAMLTHQFQLLAKSLINQAHRVFFSNKGQKRHYFKIKDQPQPQTSIVYPNQYPKNIVDAAPLVPRGRPVHFLTPKDEIPELKQMSNEDVVIRTLYNDKWKSPENAYKLNVGLIGPINSGKSQLITRLSHKISAVSPKVNTTDEILHAYKSFQIENQEGIKNVQLKYFDTPGLSHHKTGYLSKGWKVLGEIDFSLLVIDSSKKFDDLLQEAIKRLEKHRNYELFMKALVLNKIDLVQNKRKFHGLISQVQKYGKFDKIFYTSALTGYGVKQIQDYLLTLAKKGQWQCPKQVKTQSSQLEIAEQFLKEALFHRLYNHVPYDVIIQCESISSKSNGSDFLQFRVMVEDENVQRMIIGKKGQNINWVRNHFKTNYAKIYKKQVEVHVRVVVKKPGLIREQEEIESSYHQQNVRQEIKLIGESLDQQGKMIRR